MYDPHIKTFDKLNARRHCRRAFCIGMEQTFVWGPAAPVRTGTESGINAGPSRLKNGLSEKHAQRLGKLVAAHDRISLLCWIRGVLKIQKFAVEQVGRAANYLQLEVKGNIFSRIGVVSSTVSFSMSWIRMATPR